MTDGLVGGVVTTWQSPIGLSVFVFPLACQKKKEVSLSFDRKAGSSAGGQCCTCGPLFLPFDMVGLINLLQQTA